MIKKISLQFDFVLSIYYKIYAYSVFQTLPGRVYSTNHILGVLPGHAKFMVRRQSQNDRSNFP